MDELLAFTQFRITGKIPEAEKNNPTMSSTEKDSAYSLSDFLKNFPNKLVFGPPLKSIPFYVFSGRDDDDDEFESMKTLSNQWPTEAAMIDFLAKLLFHEPVLVQFWTAKSNGGNWVLTTSDQPFGVNIFHKGLASYRSHSVENNYVINDNEEAEDIGPHVRAFRVKWLEWCPDIRNYSEYPQRQYTISCGVQGLLALPVFRHMGGPCLGVLEIVTTSDQPIEFYNVQHVCDEIKKKGLVCPNIYCNCSPEKFEEDEFQEIHMASDKVCEALQIPFAQIWIPCLCWASGSSERKTYTSFAGGDCGYMLTTFDLLYSITEDNLYFFREINQLYRIPRGKGVVGRAFSSHNACFCKDITKLSIVEYPLAHYASVAKLTSSFAISLRASNTGNIVYILEFFLHPEKIDGEKPWIFLDSLLGTMKQHFHNFRVASGEELGGKLSIEVIKLSVDDELNSFGTCQTTRSPPRLEALRDGEKTMQLDSPYQQLTVEVATNSGRNVVGAEQRNSTSYLPRLEACQNGGERVQLDSSYQKNMAEVDATNNEKKFASADQSDIADIPLEKRGLAEGSPAEGSDREGETSREDLEKLFGKDIENAAKTLGVSRSTFKRKCRKHGIKRWPFPKRNKVAHSPSQLESIRGGNKQTGESSRRDCLPCDKAPKQATTSIASTMPHASAKQNESSVAMKATYGNDIIKFWLPFTSRMLELEEAVAKRLKLKAGSYKIKYEDEDDDWVLVSCDEDLQDCISTWRSLDRSPIKLSVLPITD